MTGTKRLISLDDICGKRGKRGDTAGKFPIAPSRLYYLMNKGEFPLPLKIGRRSFWIESEIDQFIADLAAKRDAAPSGDKYKPILPPTDVTAEAAARLGGRRKSGPKPKRAPVSEEAA